MSGDNSMSAIAKRKQLEAELAEAQAELDDSYYNRSIDMQQEALDKELDNFTDNKETEIEGWEKYLENVEAVVADSISAVKENTNAVLTTLQAMQSNYGLAITQSLLSPWQAGESAIQEYGMKLNISLTTMASMLGMTVDEMALKLGTTTEGLVSSLDISVAQLANNLGLTNEQMAAKLGITTASLESSMGLTIQDFATKMGITLPELASKLGTTTAGLAGNLNLTISQMASKMGLSVSELANQFGISAEDLASKLGTTYQDLTNPFGLSMSATVGELEKLAIEYNNILAGIKGDSKIAVDEVNEAMKRYQTPPATTQSNTNNKTQQQTAQPKQEKTITIGGKVNAGNAKIYAYAGSNEGLKQYFSSDPNYIVLDEKNGYVLVRHHKLSSGYTGWFKKSDLKAYAKGTTGTKKDQIALIDELGEELVMHANGSGKLSFLSKGSSVIPHDISENLMELGQLDPSEVLNRSRPAVGISPDVHNTEINLSITYGDMVSIGEFHGDNIADLEKMVAKQFEKHTKDLNNALRRYSR